VKGQGHDTPNFLPVRPSYASGIHLDGLGEPCPPNVGRSAAAFVDDVHSCLRPRCSVYKAASQPGLANYESISVGGAAHAGHYHVRRAEVLRCRSPRAQARYLRIPIGFHQASKVRILPYLAADVFTIGLAEQVLWSMELILLERATCVANVTYDRQQTVELIQGPKRMVYRGC
jgi:hypothetical protein